MVYSAVVSFFQIGGDEQKTPDKQFIHGTNINTIHINHKLICNISHHKSPSEIRFWPDEVFRETVIMCQKIYLRFFPLIDFNFIFSRHMYVYFYLLKITKKWWNQKCKKYILENNIKTTRRDWHSHFLILKALISNI